MQISRVYTRTGEVMIVTSRHGVAMFRGDSALAEPMWQALHSNASFEDCLSVLGHGTVRDEDLPDFALAIDEGEHLRVGLRGSFRACDAEDSVLGTGEGAVLLNEAQISGISALRLDAGPSTGEPNPFPMVDGVCFGGAVHLVLESPADANEVGMVTGDPDDAEDSVPAEATGVAEHVPEEAEQAERTSEESDGEAERVAELAEADDGTAPVEEAAPAEEEASADEDVPAEEAAPADEATATGSPANLPVVVEIPSVEELEDTRLPLEEPMLTSVIEEQEAHSETVPAAPPEDFFIDSVPGVVHGDSAQFDAEATGSNVDAADQADETSAGEDGSGLADGEPGASDEGSRGGAADEVWADETSEGDVVTEAPDADDGTSDGDADAAEEASQPSTPVIALVPPTVGGPVTMDIPVSRFPVVVDDDEDLPVQRFSAESLEASPEEASDASVPGEAEPARESEGSPADPVELGGEDPEASSFEENDGAEQPGAEQLDAHSSDVDEEGIGVDPEVDEPADDAEPEQDSEGEETDDPDAVDVLGDAVVVAAEGAVELTEDDIEPTEDVVEHTEAEPHEGEEESSSAASADEQAVGESPARTVEIESQEVAPEDGETVMASHAAELRAQIGEHSPRAMVLGMLCVYGHVNPPHGSVCRNCGGPLVGEPNWYARPALGEVWVSTGLNIPLDADIVIGRRPASTTEPGRPRAHLVPVPSPDQQISRTHCEIRVESWDVRLIDHNSNNGTYVLRPNQHPIRVSSTEPFFLQVGDIIDVGEGVTLQMLGPRKGN